MVCSVSLWLTFLSLGSDKRKDGQRQRKHQERPVAGQRDWPNLVAAGEAAAAVDVQAFVPRADHAKHESAEQQAGDDPQPAAPHTCQ